MLKPFALEIYQRFVEGRTIQQLALELDIPADRIERRIRAAAAYLNRQKRVA